MKSKILILVVIVILILIIDGIINKYRIVTTTYDLQSDKITGDYTFVQISDYHSNSRQNQKLLEITKENNPDYILLSGDILESEDMSSTIEFISKLMEISPVVYARGNHEDQYGTYTQFRSKLKELGVIVVDSNNYQVDDLNFIGIEDFDLASVFLSTHFDNEYKSYISSYEQFVQPDKYNVLLAHRPNYLETYADLDVDLVVSGHAHGGQWRIPFTDIGIIAPDEGLFPTHVHGLMQSGDTYQAISSGTSNPYGLFIPRFFNPEEVVVINVSAN